MSITTLPERNVAAHLRATSVALPRAELAPQVDLLKARLTLPRLPEGVSFFADVFPFIAAMLLIIGFVLMAVPLFADHSAGFLGGSALAGR
ncbi:MAG: hypothetical protein B7Z58_08195 [Acidiphilium sp. 37-64-53]|uniref:hypothetical protein n=1 Tax=Acidiphilium TaxID=522 RepID=UPI000BD21DA5|nr:MULTISPECIES: hypothetical protein [Acidiphilium]OYW02323.1 MAG: hypothetical protein B7Z58_08195 [Acidiphilium sp. 37-64-53]OZB29258.1 MAG: hypothetical protein B7X49_07825 [Acidiphilium sp. 34-64-41]HQT85476.1 hypothetical protein [Acidiphilium rubrum]